jgi:hypothetical protein
MLDASKKGVLLAELRRTCSASCVFMMLFHALAASAAEVVHSASVEVAQRGAHQPSACLQCAPAVPVDPGALRCLLDMALSSLAPASLRQPLAMLVSALHRAAHKHVHTWAAPSSSFIHHRPVVW